VARSCCQVHHNSSHSLPACGGFLVTGWSLSHKLMWHHLGDTLSKMPIIQWVYSPLLILFVLLWFCWHWGLNLLSKCSTIWGLLSAFFALFSDTVSNVLPGVASDCDSTTYASHIAGILKVSPHAWLVLWDKISLTFLLGAASNCDPTVSAS
jgi:hypothetical protein